MVALNMTARFPRGWMVWERKKCEQASKTRAKVSFRTWPWTWHTITSAIFSWSHRSPLAQCGRRLHRCEYLEVGILGSHHERWWAMEFTTAGQQIPEFRPWWHISHWSSEPMQLAKPSPSCSLHACSPVTLTLQLSVCAVQSLLACFSVTSHEST